MLSAIRAVDHPARDGDEADYGDEETLPDLIEIAATTAGPETTSRRSHALRLPQKMAIENIPYALSIVETGTMGRKWNIG